ncbi:efflux RND transporter periplasmic adaptor subunit [Denitromonas ohlonensis]|uniref:Efflux RND transporter periplasmic adaptor subunit n=2 Tax=Denitromonas TaxID=139331 RepID=A0A557RV62_9RHOO|nr:efflux RND transporter periplasmic adaptor subunit [Denitromonas ohlonensis]TVO69044.1 efflux RND transporter periplasmic adaptor subunit [Denitromonas ohlonensis]TVO77144.1 efflux RND transporter periplasmic adaptor subunit [Denitromonas ohlonensis]
MRLTSKVVLIGTFALGVAGSVVAQNGDAGKAAPQATAVEAQPVARLSLGDEVSAVGTLRSSESVVLRPETAGRIAKIGFVEGRPVKRGDMLIGLDASVQAAELAQARAGLSLAQANFRRTEDLFNRKFVSQRALDEARAGLRVAEAADQVAAARLARMTVRAPFDGIVGIRKVSIGDYVKEGADLVNLEAIDMLKVDFRLPERHIGSLAPGQRLTVSADALGTTPFPATVTAIDPLIDAEGRAIRLQATLDNREGKLRPGMFARVRLSLGDAQSVLVVPEQALVPTAEGQFVFRIVEGKAQRTAVQVGRRQGTSVEITDGLPEGAEVVTAGQIKLRDGAPVRTVAPAR